MSSIVLGVGRRERTAITSQPTSWKTGEAVRNLAKRINDDPTLVIEPPRPVRPKGDERDPGEKAIER